MADLEAKREAQVEHQCKRLGEISGDLCGVLQKLEKRLEPILTPPPPKPEEGKDAEQHLCSLATTLRVIANNLESETIDVRNLVDRIEL